MVAFDADTAERWARRRAQISGSPGDQPDDARHAGFPGAFDQPRRPHQPRRARRRQFGKPAVVGVTELEIDLDNRSMTIGEDIIVREGEWISLDGTRGVVYLGQVPTAIAGHQNPYLIKLLGWADEIRKIGVWANADYPRQRAREYGAQGIGLAAQSTCSLIRSLYP